MKFVEKHENMKKTRENEIHSLFFLNKQSSMPHHVPKKSCFGYIMSRFSYLFSETSQCFWAFFGHKMSRFFWGGGCRFASDKDFIFNGFSLNEFILNEFSLNLKAQGSFLKIPPKPTLSYIFPFKPDVKVCGYHR